MFGAGLPAAGKGRSMPYRMDGWEAAHRRLRSQHLSGPGLADPVAVVRHFGAIQAQEYPVAKWSVAQRTSGFDDAAVQRLIDGGAILRTHLLRPTWHFVAADDLGWMQALTADRVHVLNRYYYRQHGLDAEWFGRTNAVIAAALRGGKPPHPRRAGRRAGRRRPPGHR